MTRGRALLALAALLGFVLVFAAAFLYRRPDLRRHLLETARYGTTSEEGLLMLLEPGVASPGSMTVVFANVGDEPRALLLPEGDRVGVEVDVLVTDAAGAPVPPSPPPFDPATPAARPRKLELAPGARERVPLDLSRFHRLPPGRYRVRVERARLNREEPRLRSNELTLELGGNP